MEIRALVRNDVFSGDYALVRIPLQTGGMAAASLPKKRLPSEEETRHKWSESLRLLGKTAEPQQTTLTQSSSS